MPEMPRRLPLASKDTDCSSSSSSLGGLVNGDDRRSSSETSSPPTTQFPSAVEGIYKTDHNTLERSEESDTRSPRNGFPREREHRHSSSSRSLLIQHLIKEEHESKETKKLLQATLLRLQSSSRRVSKAEAERRDAEASQVTQGLAITQAVLDAQREAARAEEEVGSYKAQLDHAQKEILRAREIVKAVELERDEAERVAARARTMARRLREEKILFLAREEGRREGFEEGMKAGRLALTRDESKMIDYGQPRGVIDDSSSRPREDRGAYVEQRGRVLEAGDRVNTPGSTEIAPLPNRLSSGLGPSRRDNGRQYATLQQIPQPNSTTSRSNQTPGRTRAMDPPKERSVPQVSRWAPISTASASVRTHSQPTNIRTARSASSKNPRPARVTRQEDSNPEARSDGSDSFFAVPPSHDRQTSTLFASQREVQTQEPVIERQPEAKGSVPREPNPPREARRSSRLERQAPDLESESTAPPSMLVSSVMSAPVPPPLPYLRMPAPPQIPVPVVTPAPVQPVVPAPQPPQQTQSQPQPHVQQQRRSSPEPRTPSSTATGISQLNLISFPSSSIGGTRGSSVQGDRERDREPDREWARELSVIHEDDTTAHSTSQLSPTTPTWSIQPPMVGGQGVPGSNQMNVGGPVQHLLGSQFQDRQQVEDWRRATNIGTQSDTGRQPPNLPPSPNTLRFLAPPFQPQSRMRADASNESLISSRSSISVPGITVEPPSRPPSGGHGPSTDEGPGFLSPNHAHRNIPLAPTNPVEPPVIPVIPDTLSYTRPAPNERPLNEYLPPGFVPQTASPQPGINVNLGGGGSNFNGSRTPESIPRPSDQPGTNRNGNGIFGSPFTFSQDPASPQLPGPPTFAFRPPSPRDDGDDADSSTASSSSSSSSDTSSTVDLSPRIGGAETHQHHSQLSPGPQFHVGGGMPVPMTPRQTYAVAPTPPGFSYPAPLAAMSPGRAAETAPVIPSVEASPHSHRSQTPHPSKSLFRAGTTPTSNHSTFPGSSVVANEPIRKSALRKGSSNASQSPGNFYTGISDSTTFQHNTSNESLLDPTTAMNTLANSASATPARIPGWPSPARPFVPFP